MLCTYVLYFLGRGWVVLTKSIKEARSTFSQLIDQVQKGETVGITRHGRQAAVLVSAHTA
ncbi:MAG: type II toxin-antitoxin system Phd/YefM family antitoxin, partial [Kiritimatiellia bacterium]